MFFNNNNKLQGLLPKQYKNVLAKPIKHKIVNHKYKYCSIKLKKSVYINSSSE